MRPALAYGRAGGSAPASDTGGIVLPQIRVPVATDGPASVGGPVSGMSIR